MSLNPRSRARPGPTGTRARSGGVGVQGDTLIIGLTSQNFGDQRLVVAEPRTVSAILRDRHAVAGRLCELDAVPDYRFEVATVEVTVKLVDDRLHERRPARIERDEHAGLDVVIGLLGQ